MARVKRGHHLLGIFLGGKTIPLIHNTPLFTKDIITYYSNKFLEDYVAFFFLTRHLDVIFKDT